MFAEHTIRSQALDVRGRLLVLIHVIRQFLPHSFGACGKLRNAQKLLKFAVQRLLADWSVREARAVLLVVESITASLYKMCFDETSRRMNGIQGEPIAPALVPALRDQAIEGLQAFGVLVEALVRAKNGCGGRWARRSVDFVDDDEEDAGAWDW